MSPTLLRTAAVFIVLGGLLYCAQFILTTGLEEQSRRVLVTLGGDPALLPQATHRPGMLVYKNVPLDTEDISQIGTYTLAANWRGQMRAIIADVTLTGEIDDTGALSLSGLKDTASTTFRWETLATIDQFSVHNMRIGILTPLFGGIEIILDLEAQRQDDETFLLQGRLSSTQQSLAFDLSINGTLGPRQGNIQLELANARLDAAPWGIKFTRASGTGQITPDTDGGYRLLADLQAGGLSAGESHWQSVSATYERTTDFEKLWLEGKALAQPDVEFNFQRTAQGGHATTEGQVQIPNTASLALFRGKNPALSADKRFLRLVLDRQTTLDFAVEKDAEKDTGHAN